MKKLTRCLGLMALCAVPGFASALDMTGAYLGGSFGRARSEYDTSILDTQLLGLAQAAGAPITFDKSAVQRLSGLWMAQAGWYFADNLAAEVSFIHAGQLRYFSLSTITLGGVPQTAYSTNEVSSHGPAFSLVARLPLTPFLEVSARVGDYVGRTHLDQGLLVGSSPSYGRADKTASSLLAGVGIAVNLASHWQVRADYLRLNKIGGDNTQKFSINALTGGINFVF